MLSLALTVPCLAETTGDPAALSPQITPAHFVLHQGGGVLFPGKTTPRPSDLLALASSDAKASPSHPTGRLRAKVVPVDMIDNQTYGDPPFMLQAKSNSPGPITYSLVSGKATVSPAGLVTLTGTGSITVEAIQAATTDYTSATQTATFLVAPGTPTIAFAVTNATNVVPFPLAASSNSTGVFTYSVVSGPAKINGNMVTLTGTGAVVLQASEAADANYSAASKIASFNFGAPALVVAANNATRQFGAPNPAFSGSITGSSQGNAFVETFSTAATTASAPGTYSIVPVASGPGLSNYTVDTVNGTLTVTQASTTTTLSASSTTLGPNQPLTLTAQVTSATTGTPSGSVTFFDKGTPLQSASIGSGTASITITLPLGTAHLFTATSSGDSNFLASPPSSGVSITASAAPVLTVAANDASRLYGEQNPSFSGSITGSNPGDVFTESFSTPATPASAPGTYTVVPAVSGPALGNYTVDKVNGALTIAPAPSVLTLSSSSTTLDPNQTLSLTAHVASTTTGTPSGSVTFFDNGAALQTVPLSNAVASHTTTLSPGVVHVLTATSSGDTNFLASPQSPSISVTASSQDFAFTSMGSTTVLSAPGRMATYTFSISPLFGGLGAPVTFSVIGLPNSASAAFTPSSLAPNTGASTVQLYIQTAAQVVSRDKQPGAPSGPGVVVAAAFLLTFTGSRNLRRKLNGRLFALIFIALGLSGTILLSGCGSGVLEQGPGTYSLSVIATSGTLQHTQNVTLTMQ